MSFLIGVWVSILEGILFSVCYILTAKIHKTRRLWLMALFILIEIATVWLLYRGNEAVWPFFVHPYISLMILNVADYFYIKRDKFEKFFLWPFYVLPAISGFVLVWGWMFKIHAFKEIFGRYASFFIGSM